MKPALAKSAGGGFCHLDFSTRLALIEGEALLTLMHTPNSWAALEALRLIQVTRDGDRSAARQ
jgi:hypothetical protein